VEADGSFSTWPRLARYGQSARAGSSRLHLRDVRLRHGIRELRFRAVIKGLGRSNVVRVRIRH
jgi:hypothetical protein